MPISSITQILLRLFALNWLVRGLISTITSIQQFGLIHSFYALLPPVVYIAAGIIFWYLAPGISRAVANRNDGEVSMDGITETQLLSTVFVGLGAWFVLQSFAAVFNWAHFFAVYKSPDYGFHKDAPPSYYDFTEQGLTFAAGLLFIFFGRKWARKLVSRDRKKLS